ncbi:MAG: hypothetical protein M3461_22540 [Pseudomonadota bacterium]|nr:hypothetical protein [Pseudomonadota bacterium]
MYSTPAAQGVLAGAGLGARAAWTSGDFFEAVPPGGDLYLLKSVLHNWDDAHAARILRRCREAMSPESRLLVIERLLPTGNGPSEAKLFDISMLVVLGGRERTEGEYRVLLGSTGLELRRVIPTECPLSLFEAIPILDPCGLTNATSGRARIAPEPIRRCSARCRGALARASKGPPRAR